MKVKHKKKRRRLNWPRVLLALLLLYWSTGCARLAVDSWINPEHHARCVALEVCSPND